MKARDTDMGPLTIVPSLLKISGIELVVVAFSSLNHHTPVIRYDWEGEGAAMGSVASLWPSCREWRVICGGS